MAEIAAPIQGLVDVGNGSPGAVAHAWFNSALVTGEYPFVRQTGFRSWTEWADIRGFVLKAGGEIRYEASIGSDHVLTATMGGQLVIVTRDEDYGVPRWSISIAAPAAESADKTAASFGMMLPHPPPPPPPAPHPDNEVLVRFWMQNPVYKSADYMNRWIQVTNWGDVNGNYPESTQAKVSPLMSSADPAGGKLILFHGPPGTGKTRAILSLISEWRDWCAASVITDSDRFFGDPTYMNDLVFSMDGSKEWLLLIVEDGDEFMNVDGRDSKGQSIGRLLNVADGIIGQGLNLLTLITTNVPMEQLNPAIVREGRCMANIEFPAFDAEASQAWLEAKGVSYTGDAGLTLAQMYSRVRLKDRAAGLLTAFGEETG